ncbi:ADP-glucose phosphorylase isoform X2 [Capsicum annuum]|uniref:ADP-glucose phosphorylase isoform X2 n=1 Tax=Capsicum annuum TaxID=4072 RepID=UPI001FB065A2|nr:ADP-glucose phosphorylase isoform X2 [Capsicum annuum]
MAESETPNRSPEIRKDRVNNRWVLFSPARSRRPSDFKAKSNPQPNNQTECPFCAGHEHECAPEIFRIPADSTNDWKIRVIQNLYPAVSRELDFQNSVSVIGDVAVSGFGFHDVVIESPIHSVNLSDLPPVEVGEVLLAAKKRIEQLRNCESIKYVQVFKNHGASAGASMSHSHSQMIALPIVPPTVSARLDSKKEYYKQTGKCYLCDIQPNELLIDESAHFISLVPFAATFAFEIWIIPRDHSSHFHEIDSEKLNNPPFNLLIHTSPFQDDPSAAPSTHWFLQIAPHLSGVGGFEIATGCYINPVFPEDAARILRDVKISN